MAGETPNDRNDRAIRTASLWYQRHLGKGPPILLLTNDAENKRKALHEGIRTETVQTYVESLGHPELLDLVVQVDSGVADMDVEDLRPSKKKMFYSEHRPMSEITSGLQQRIFHQGKLRVNRYNPLEAYVSSESIDEEIIIYGRIHMNRAFDGDVVAVELLPEDQWKGGNALKLAEDEEEEETDETVGLAPDSADAVPPLPQGKPRDPEPKVGLRPCGRVVGVIKRNWHSYCGSLEPMPLPAGVGGAVNVLFVSSDKRIPKIRIQTRQLGNLLDKRILVAVDSWDRSLRYPLGHYVKTIGDIGDRTTESEVLMIENDINNRPFSEQVLACLPPLPWSVSQDDLSCPYREDLRHVRVFSVDPPGCKDIDDALHCTALPNGNFEVGVRIRLGFIIVRKECRVV